MISFLSQGLKIGVGAALGFAGSVYGFILDIPWVDTDAWLDEDEWID